MKNYNTIIIGTPIWWRTYASANASYKLYGKSIIPFENNGGGIGHTLNNVNDEINMCFKPFHHKLETGSVIVWKKYQVSSVVITKLIENIRNAFRA